MYRIHAIDNNTARGHWAHELLPIEDTCTLMCNVP